MRVKDPANSYWPTDEESAREILKSKNEPPYAIYNYMPQYLQEDVAYHIDSANNIYSMYREDELVGYCSFGQDGRVPGGEYSELALDIGLMIKPELTGQGLGSEFIEDVIRFARKQFKPNQLRVTILTTNLRAIRVWEKSGFQKTQTFKREGDGLPFIIMTKDM